MNSGSKALPNSQVVIVGGTSGIGLALAHAHLAQNWQVWVVGHHPIKIAEIKQRYPKIQIICCDLTDRAARQHLFAQLKTITFSRLIYCAGWYLNERISTLDQQSSDHMLAINLQAFQETFIEASTQLKQHTQQQVSSAELVTIASVAGLLDYPYSSLYAQSKQAMIATAQAYRTALAPHSIKVITIAPGYIDTATLRALNNGDASHKPFIISEQQAIKRIMQAIDHNVALTVFPKPMKYLIKGLSLLPKPVLGWLMLKKLDKSHSNQ